MKTIELTPSQRAIQLARDIHSGVMGQSQTAKKLGINRTYLSFASTVLKSGNVDLIKEVEDGLKSLRDAVKEAQGKPPVIHAAPVVDPSLPEDEKMRLYQARHREKHHDSIRENWNGWYQENKNQVNNQRRENYDVQKEAIRYQLKGKANYFLRKYGISLDTLIDHIGKQGGRCKVCRRQFAEKRKPHVDHDHGPAGHVRGILCGQCNQAEGLLGSIQTARAMVSYMEANSLFYETSSNYQ